MSIPIVCVYYMQVSWLDYKKKVLLATQIAWKEGIQAFKTHNLKIILNNAHKWDGVNTYIFLCLSLYYKPKSKYFGRTRFYTQIVMFITQFHPRSQNFSLNTLCIELFCNACFLYYKHTRYLTMIIFIIQ